MRQIIIYGFHLSCRLIKVFVVLIALLLLLARAMTSYVEDYAETIIDKLSISLGVPVEVDSVEAEWRGLSPFVYLEGVRIGEQKSLSFDSILVKPDALSSLVGWTIAWSRFDVQGMDINLQELPSGSLSVAGMEIGGGSGGGANYIEEMILESNRVSVVDSNIHITTLRGTRINLELNSLALNYAFSFRRLSIEATLGAPENKLSAVAELTGNAGRFFDLQGLAYASIDAQNLNGIYREFLDRIFPQNSIQLNSESSMKAQFWANLTSDDELAFQGSVEVDDIPEQVFGFDCASSSRCVEKIASARMGVYGAYSPLMQFIDFREPQIDLFGDLIQAPDFRVTRKLHSTEVDYGFLLPSMDLSVLMSSINKFPLPSDALTESLLALDPSGQVSFLSLELPNFDPHRFRLSGRVKALDIGSYRGAPSGKNINADFLISKTKGLIAVTGTDSGIFFPEIYDDWFQCKQISTTVSWYLDLEKSRIHIASNDAVIETDQAVVTGAFRVDAPLTKGQSVAVDLSLALGFENVLVADHTVMVPDSIPDTLGNWLDSALIAGSVEQGAVFYRGSLRRGEVEKRTTQVRVKVSEAEIRFMDSWPSLTNLDGELWLSDNSVRAYSPSAQILDLTLESSIVNVEIPPSLLPVEPNIDQAPTPQIMLSLSSSARGKTSSAIDLVRTTSLRNAVGDSLDDLDFIGDLTAKIDLTMPVKETLDREELDINIVAEVDSNVLALEKQNLSIEGIGGQLMFDNSGFHTEKVAASIWGEPISMQIVEDIELGFVGVDLSGDVDVLDVTDWLQLPVTDELISGDVEVQGRIDLMTGSDPSKASNRYHFWSNLIGAQTQLPPPFDKQPDQSRYLDVLVKIDDQITTSLRLALDDSMRSEGYVESYNENQEEIEFSQEYKQEYRNELIFELVQEIQTDRLQNKQSESAASELLTLGASLAVAKGEEVSITQPDFKAGWFVADIALSDLSLTPWQEAGGNRQEKNESPAAQTNARVARIFGLEPEISLEVNALEYKDKDLGATNIEASEQDSTWHFMFETDYLLGHYQLSNLEESGEKELEGGIIEGKSEAAAKEESEAVVNVEIGDVIESVENESNLSMPLLTIVSLDVDLLKAQLFPVEIISTDDEFEAVSDEALEDNAELSAQFQLEAIELDPRQLPALRFDIQSLQMEGLERGSWSGVMQHFDTGLLVSELKGGYGSLMLAEQDSGSSFFWGVDDYGQFTELNLTFNYQDIGDLFRLTGLAPAMSSDKGLLYASLNWKGGPQEFSINSIEGIMGFSAENGAFNTSEQGVPNALLKTIGLFNVGSWTRRLKFDFSDVTANGTPYDRIIGDFVVENGQVFTLTPVSVDLSSGDILFDGNIDLNTEELDARLVVTLPARQNMTWVAALVGGLPTAAGVWLVGQIFDDELDSLSSVSYRIEGTLDKPDVSADKIFDSTIKN